jgi:predicted transcriptional regulator of viral defense system
VAVSDLEKTIVDAVSKPDLCGGLTEVGKAIYESRTKIDHQKLFDYFTRNEMQVAKKRYLFLSDLLDLEWSLYHESMMNNLGSGYPLLDTTGLDQGRRDSKFGLRINVDMDTIKNAIYT